MPVSVQTLVLGANPGLLGFAKPRGPRGLRLTLLGSSEILTFVLPFGHADKPNRSEFEITTGEISPTFTMLALNINLGQCPAWLR